MLFVFARFGGFARQVQEEVGALKGSSHLETLMGSSHTNSADIGGHPTYVTTH